MTDAGMPSVSDPGYRLVAAAVEHAIRVTVVPGPSAVLAALAVSGLPVDRFCFEGFLPRKAGDRARVLAALATERRTLVFFEAPHRLAESLAAMAVAFGAQRRGRGLPRADQDLRGGAQGSAAELAAWAAPGVRGEITVVVRGAAEAEELDDATLAGLVAERMNAGSSRKQAVAEVSATTGDPRNRVYAAAVAVKIGWPASIAWRACSPLRRPSI